jgi:hypothetical protein
MGQEREGYTPLYPGPISLTAVPASGGADTRLTVLVKSYKGQ